MKKLVLVIVPFFCVSMGQECGIAIVRLRKPLEYYKKTHGSATWGLNQLFQLIESQRNRGHDGAGLAVVKFDMPAGHNYMRRVRFAGNQAIESLLRQVMHNQLNPRDYTKLTHPFLGEAYLGHVRSGTLGSTRLKSCQPYFLKNNVASKQFALAGNFNMTNTETLFQDLVNRGLTLTHCTEMHLISEQIRYHLDQEHDYLATKIAYQSTKELDGLAINQAISERINLARVLQSAARNWDGGYLFGGLLGNGDLFICRDPAGIRPGFYYMDDDVFAAASERAALCAVFGCLLDAVHPIKPGHIITIKRNGAFTSTPFIAPQQERQCILERISFSRPHDPDISAERKRLGMQLAKRVLDLINWDVENAFFTFVPTSGDAAFDGLTQEIQRLLCVRTATAVTEHLQKGLLTPAKIKQLCNCKLRIGQLLHKNQAIHTAITQEATRATTAIRPYETTKGTIQSTDTVIVIDDLIVDGIALRESIIPQLIALNPKQIIIISSAPPVQYPDCYGIGMGNIGKFIAFQAAVQIHKECNNQALLEEIFSDCNQYEIGENKPAENHVKKLYDSITHEALEAKISQLISPTITTWGGAISVIYQKSEDLCLAIPHHTGDWVFSGNYPTPGGSMIANKSFLFWRQLINT